MKVLVHTANANDACSFYRGVGPWSALVKASPQEFQVTYGTDFCWGDIRAADILFLLRPTLESVRPLIQCAKDWGTKVWVDWDDDPFTIPSDNPSFEMFSRASVQNVIREAMKSADLLTVSTERLKEAFGPLSSNISVLPNSFDEAFLRWRNPHREKPNKYVFWRGSRTHDRDIDSVSAGLVNCAINDPTWSFIFMGSDPCAYRVSEMMPNVIRIPMQKTVMDYMKILSALNPTIMIAPLALSEFNRSKSCIAALEGFFAGAAAVGPNFQEWQIPGCVRYDSHERESFEKVLTWIMEDKTECEAQAREGFEYITGERSLKRVNLTRRALAWELFEALS